MKLRKLLIIVNVVASIWVISIFAASAPDGSRIEGTVSDPTGAGLKGALVLVHWDPVGSSVGLRTNVGIAQDLTTFTDVNGRFSVALPPGFYDVLFCASAFSPKAKKIRILPGSVLRYETQLQLDTTVTDVLGDKFR
jgi:hypothetical protein